MSTTTNRPTGGTAARIAEDIGSAIVAGRYRADELVPGEFALSRKFRASRPVVREALKLLSAKGLIDARKRTGTRARPREAWHMLDADVLAWHLKEGRRKRGKAEPKFVFDLLHARAVIEPAAAAMAARSHTARTLKPIEAAFADMEANAHDRVLFAAPDIRFHKAILSATGNDFIAAFGALIETALGAFVRIASRHKGAPAPSVPLHRAILEAIRRRDAEGAHAAMLALLHRTARNVQRNVKRGSRQR
ncbi:MAG TPA: FadR/GntR family transcriptional regulator [Reyranella sp.]|jgi:DNA-binding FadR family transcriptional regulator|nr:FadR/GntR family transcriptional regulator [Reyranella sp.]